MANRLEVTINVIIHATEDISKFMSSFDMLFCLKEEEFTIQKLSGHYDNQITVVNTKLVKKQAREFLDKIIERMSNIQVKEIVDSIENRIDDSTLHIRLNKQEFIKGKIEIREKDSVKIKISIPIYNKKNKVQSFTEIFQPAN